METTRARLMVQTAGDFYVSKLLRLTASAAYHEQCGFSRVVIMAAGDVGVQGFQTVNVSILDEAIEGAVHGRRRTDTVRSQEVENPVCGERAPGAVEGMVHLLVDAAKRA